MAKNMPILIVDDYKTMLRILRGLLTDLGFTDIDEATDGVTAWEMIGKKQYALIISDWNMEPVSGFELLKQVRGNEATRATPFIIVTSDSKSEHIIAAKQAGVSNYMVKPFTAETLKQKMQSVLGPM